MIHRWQMTVYEAAHYVRKLTLGHEARFGWSGNLPPPFGQKRRAPGGCPEPFTFSHFR